MRRPLLARMLLSAGLLAATGWTSGVAARAQAPTPGQTQENPSARFLAALQNPDGGFAPAPGQASTLGSTSSAIRTLKFLGGSVPDIPKAIEFLKSCQDPATGAFAPKPGGKPDVATTAIALLVFADLKQPTKELADKAIAFFHENAKSFDDVRIAVAGLEAVKATSPDFPRWAEIVNEGRNADGTWGQAPTKGRITGERIVALLRMGQTPDEATTKAVVEAMRAGQNPDGGWSKDGGPVSDTGTTYRVMRGFYMLKQLPNLDAVRAYVARHATADGAFAQAPGGVSDVGGTYTAAILTYWANLLEHKPPFVETAGFTPLFDGKSLNGWEGNAALWSARDGLLVGKSPGLDHNEFLATNASYGDFVLKVSFRLVGDQGNSGVQFRSVRVPGTEMSGYQADIGEGYWGGLYDESRRNKVLVPGSKEAIAKLNADGWNHYVIRCSGKSIVMTLNGVTDVKYEEDDSSVARDGRIALQIHAGGPMEVQFKDILIQPLPSPTAEGDATAPGFHLRTVKTPGGDRKYTLWVPEGYDASKAWPAILFLHGSGERGEDGVIQAQTGIGPAIAANPGRFPALVVIPQAKKTWAAGSDDANEALAALEDVTSAFKVDPDRVVLTGLSMGGSGAWQMAASHPKKFSAVVPICGQGKLDSVDAIKGLPFWTVVGDDDRDATVLNMREMVAALRSAGAKAGQTEFRGVGHNSWDRAYNDAGLIGWMLAQSRSKP
ncbi:family 16 glycoside hydrolase [Isosphaeraceae bacterium EP7]